MANNNNYSGTNNITTQVNNTTGKSMTLYGSVAEYTAGNNNNTCINVGKRRSSTHTPTSYSLNQ